MKKFIFFIFILVCAAAAWFLFLKVPFPEKYTLAKEQFKSGQVEDALPVLRKAAEFFKDKSEYEDAVYYLAKCETSIDKNHRSNWQLLIKETTDKNKIREAEYQLARTSSDTVAAEKQFIEKYPESKEAKEFMILISSEALKQNNIKSAESVLQKLADYHGNSPEAKKMLKTLGEINMKNFYSRTELPFIDYHVVKSGEYLSTIAKKNKTSVGSIKRINGFTGDTIRKGNRLKIDKSEYLMKIDISDNILTLYRIFDGQTNFVKRYSVGTGKEDNTPRGAYKVNLKQKEPIWHKPGGTPIPYGSKENELGTRWMGIDCPGFGLHGTWKPETVGEASSAGCIRMLNKDVEELFDITPFGVTVIIED